MTMTDGFSLAATIILMFPLMYFTIVTPNFFFFKFDDLTVTRVMRGLFNVYFLSLVACCMIGITAFAVAGRPPIAAAIGLIGALAVPARIWFLRKIDAQLRARNAGDIDAAPRLRRLHVAGMVYNGVQFIAVLASIPFVFVTAT